MALAGIEEFGDCSDRTQFYTLTNPDGTRQEPPKQALEYGWEPDGSGKIWHNTEQENLRVPIQSVKFDYGIVKPRYDEKQIDRVLPMQVNAPAERTSEQVAALQTSLAEMLKYLRWIATAITVIAVYLMVISFIKK